MLLWLTLACFSMLANKKSLENRSIGPVGLVVSLKKQSKWAWFTPKWAWLLNFRAHFACRTTIEPPFKKSWIRPWALWLYGQMALS